MRKPALVLVAGGLVLAGCGGGGNESSTATPARTENQVTTSPISTAAPPTTTTAVAKAKVIDIRIKGGKPVNGITRVTVKKPQLVDLVVHSDVADEVHLHGYDLQQDVDAGGTARIRFQANITGVFEAELESRGLQILDLTVK